jgi:acyl-CoA thioesterase
MDLSTAMSPRAGGALEVPAGWRQGRGAFGGLVVGAMLRAIEAAVGDPARTPRAVTAEIYGPVGAGPADIATYVLRTGKQVTTVRAELVQDHESLAHAVAIVSGVRKGEMPRWLELAAPAAQPWDAVAPLAMPAGDAGPFPEFATNFEYRIVEGMPFTGPAAPARCIGWVRAREPGTARADAALIAALCDAWWPTALVRATQPRPMGTIAFTLEVVTDLAAIDPAAPFVYRATSPVCADGYFLETRELWTADGRLVAVNQQTFAVIA